jgi:Tfp pilus assembly protein PilE
LQRGEIEKMRALAIAAIIASLAVPAFAQDPNKEAQSKAEEQKRKEADEIEKAYKDAVKRTNREQPVKKADPWGNMR